MIILKNVALRRGTKVLLDNASVTLNPGEKVGLVGRNGAGKSSLFSLLAGRLHADAGDVEIPPSWLQPGGMAEVAQNMPETDQSATDFVLEGDTRLAEVQRQLAEAEASDDGMAIAHAYSDLHDAGAHDAVARAQARGAALVAAITLGHPAGEGVALRLDDGTAQVLLAVLQRMVTRPRS